VPKFGQFPRARPRVRACARTPPLPSLREGGGAGACLRERPRAQAGGRARACARTKGPPRRCPHRPSFRHGSNRPINGPWGPRLIWGGGWPRFTQQTPLAAGIRPINERLANHGCTRRRYGSVGDGGRCARAMTASTTLSHFGMRKISRLLHMKQLLGLCMVKSPRATMNQYGLRCPAVSVHRRRMSWEREPRRTQ